MTVMTQDNTTKWKQSLIRMFAGGVVGMAAAAAMLGLMGGGLIDAMGPSRVALAAVGLIYCLMAALVGFGLAAPRAGAQLLNVADADELREERSGMLLSVVIMGGIGIVLILLALARTPDFAAGLIPAAGAMAVLVLVIAGGVIASWRWRGRFDELNWQLALEGCLWSFTLSWVGLTIWAAADFLGFGLVLTPIDVVTALSALMLAGCFLAIGRRGMLQR